MELSHIAAQLDSWFSARESEMLERLETLVNMDTFTSDGADVNAAGETLCGWIREAGFITQKLTKPAVPADEPWMASLGNVFTARTHNMAAGPGIAFIGHMDTVFPSGTTAARPFRMDSAADRATGPGIIDMKAGLVQNIYVARALKELGLVSVPLTLTFSPDEELGSPTTTPILGEQLKGALAVICSEPGYPGGGVTIERKGSGHMLLDIRGKSAHAGRCYADGASAILELSHKILAFDRHLDLPNDTTINTGLISGGISANSVSPCATARVHITYKTLEAGQELVQKLRKDAAITHIPGTVSTLSGGIRLPPLVPTPGVQRLFELVCKAGDSIGIPVVNVASKGVAESGFCASVLGVPTVCSMGPEGANLHAVDEYLIPSTLIPRCKLAALTAIQASYVFLSSKL